MVTHKFYEHLFSAIFALYFAANIAAAREYNAFDTAAITDGDYKALRRFVIGVVVLNIAPTLYYVYMVHMINAMPLLGRETLWSCGSIVDYLIIVFLGTAGGGFYRIFAGIMVCRLDNRQFAFYAVQDYDEGYNNSITIMESDERININRHGFYTRPSVDVRRLEIGPWRHILGSMFYLFVPGVAACVVC